MDLEKLLESSYKRNKTLSVISSSVICSLLDTVESLYKGITEENPDAVNEEFEKLLEDYKKTVDYTNKSIANFTERDSKMYKFVLCMFKDLEKAEKEVNELREANTKLAEENDRLKNTLVESGRSI